MESIPASFMNEPVFKTLGRLAQVAALTPAQKRAYDHSLKVYRDNNAIAQAKLAEGRAEGRAEEHERMIEKTRLELEALGLHSLQIEQVLKNLRN